MGDVATLTSRSATSPDVRGSWPLGEWLPWLVLAGAVVVLGPAEAVVTRSDGTGQAWLSIAVSLLLG